MMSKVRQGVGGFRAKIEARVCPSIFSLSSSLREFDGSPTIQAFLRDDSYARVLIGPVGSGKTFGCCRALGSMAYEQRAASNNVRYTRFLVARQTYSELDGSTLKSWREVYDENIFGQIAATKMPRVHHILIPPCGGCDMCGGRGESGIDMEVLFISLEHDKDISKLLSMQLTGAYLHEGQFMNGSLIASLGGRIGRYPAGKYGICSRPSLIMDCNPPDYGHWIPEYEKNLDLVGDLVPSAARWRYFHQPAAAFELSDSDASVYDGKVLPDDMIRAGGGIWRVNPDRDNAKWIGVDYYRKTMAVASSNWLDIFISANYGTEYGGRAVWPEFDVKTMERSGLVADPNLQLCFGLDFGRTPAVVFGQMDYSSRQWRILSELAVEGIDIANFAEMVRHHISLHYADFGNKIMGFCDPAGLHKGEQVDLSSYEVFLSKGFNIAPATMYHNMPQLERRDASAQPMMRFLNGEPGLLVDKDGCPRLIASLRGGYQFQKDSKDGARNEKFLKNRHSHIGDAFQYLLIGGGEVASGGLQNSLINGSGDNIVGELRYTR